MLSHDRVRFSSIGLATFAILVLFLSSAPVVFGQADPATRPPTQELLPETTVAFIQIDDFRDMMTKMQESGMGQMMADEAIAPLVEGLWEETKLAYEDVKENVGLELEDFTALPSGELTFAVIAPRRKNPEFMLILELDEESEAVDRVLDRGRELIRVEGGQEITTEESDDGIEFESFQLDDKRVKFFRKDGLVVGCTSEEELDAFIDRWMGREVEKVRPLSVNRKFVTIMNRCVGTKELKPEARFFVDPIALAKSTTRGNIAAQTGLNMLPLLGLDGLLGIGGSMILTEDDFESVVHGHVLLANPRSGVFEMISFKPTDYQPEPWLPDDVITYITTSWDIDKMLAELTKMIESFQGEEGIVDNWIENNINEETGLNLKEDVLAHLTGRVTLVQWLEPPTRINSQVNLIAIELRDAEAFEKSLEVIVDRINSENEDEDDEDRLENTDHKGIRIWSQSMARIEERMERQRERQRERRAERGQDPQVDIEINIPQPAFSIVGDYFLISPQSKKVIEHSIDTDQGDSPPLVNDEKFQEIMRKMTRLLKTDMPVAMTYSDPEESLRMIFELVQSEETNAFIDGRAENNKYLAGFKSRLDENPLPDFETLKKYFRPSGGFATSDDTGYHFLAFSLRMNPEEEDEK